MALARANIHGLTMFVDRDALRQKIDDLVDHHRLAHASLTRVLSMSSDLTVRRAARRLRQLLNIAVNDVATFATRRDDDLVPYDQAKRALDEAEAGLDDYSAAVRNA